MTLRLVTKLESMEMLADECQTSRPAQGLSRLREAYTLLYGPESDIEPWRIFNRLVEALALNEIALLLIPPGWLRSIMDVQGGPCRVELYNPTITTTSAMVGGRGGTWPLAICAAAMRAHARLLGMDKPND